jgi:hypothetical protein
MGGLADQGPLPVHELDMHNFQTVRLQPSLLLSFAELCMSRYNSTGVKKKINLPFSISTLKVAP